MPRLVPGNHVLCIELQGVDGRDKPGHDGEDSPPHAAISSAQSKFGAECVSAPDDA
jgi:hypothetical protein